MLHSVLDLVREVELQYLEVLVVPYSIWEYLMLVSEVANPILRRSKHSEEVSHCNDRGKVAEIAAAGKS